MADVLHIRPGLALPLSEVELRTSRSSGPGGQHANVTASRVEATFDVAASTTLSPEQRARISAKLGPRVTASAQDTRSRPTRASQKRRVEGKKRRGETKRSRRRPDLD